MKTYKHLTEEERNQIVVLVNRKKTFREIARILSRNVSTITREIEKNYGRRHYRAHLSHKRAVEKHHQSHKRMRLKSCALRLEVEKLLMEGWSPELIAGHLKRRTDLPPVNYESIYQWIYTEASHLKGCLVRRHPFRWFKGKGRKRKKSLIPNRIPVQQRPEIANNRTQAGHWETDLLIGKGKSVLQASTERQTRFVKLKKVPAKTATVCRLALASVLKPLPLHLRRSITYDNGSENTEHHTLNTQLDMLSYFCEPYYSWEKGTVENTNGLIRRFFPKKTNFDTISDQEVLKVESWLNHRPRKCLKFYTPAESFNSLCCT